MSAVLNLLNIGALASQPNGGSSLQICGYEFDDQRVNGSYSICIVGMFVCYRNALSAEYLRTV